MVRWGTVRGMGSFSTTVPENACRGGRDGGDVHEGHSPLTCRVKEVAGASLVQGLYPLSVTAVLRLFQCAGFNLKRLLRDGLRSH